MYHGVSLWFCVVCLLRSGVNARPRELHVRSLCSRNTDSPRPSDSQSNHPILNCDPCHFEIAIISDNDEKSKSETTPNLWLSTFAKTTLDLKADGDKFSVTVGKLDPTIISSNISADGKGMELSELIYFNRYLLTFDDKTGTVYHIIHNKVQPWITLTTCEGKNAGGYKSEWATVKEGKLIVGSAGFPWAPTSASAVEPQNCGPQWIKIINKKGEVENKNWKPMFNKLQKATKCKGYITHESVVWSSIRNRWYFAPRKCSAEPFNPKTDGMKGSHILISADDDFENVEVVEIGELVPTRGFSSFKFLPHSDDSIIVALKTHEDDKSFQTFITVFGINGKVFLPDTILSKVDKFEGVEFLPQGYE